MESHMSVHTWPEKGYVTVDVYVCNYSTDNRAKACKLFEGLLHTFRPADPRVVSVERA
jgi:S-adenosylmethionine decarboxylase